MNEQYARAMLGWAELLMVLVFGAILIVIPIVPMFDYVRNGHANGYRKAMLEAIDHGYAEYDSKTGELRWKGKE